MCMIGYHTRVCVMPDPGGVDGEVEVDNDCRRQDWSSKTSVSALANRWINQRMQGHQLDVDKDAFDCRWHS
ncbi:hypothetical protein M405DRAFT_463493 [Rhizopogon salebrosus TDB-379]|nr:hypothetical protein M405DRAFT_463493 [Rhizopogon salebrosus TDB-379]